MTTFNARLGCSNFHAFMSLKDLMMGDVSMMETEASESLEALENDTVDTAVSIDVAEDDIRSKQNYNFTALINSLRILPLEKSRMKIPLCRMTKMLFVRPSLKTDIEKLEADFLHGYREGDRVFYVSMFNATGTVLEVSEVEKATWDPIWVAENEKFERLLLSDPDLAMFSNKMFFVWDGNHRLQAWMNVIGAKHSDEPSWHYSVDSICLDPKESAGLLLDAMQSINE